MCRVSLLIDADGITLVAENPDLRAAVVARSAPTLLTPHAGEFARLGGDLDARRSSGRGGPFGHRELTASSCSKARLLWSPLRAARR